MRIGAAPRRPNFLMNALPDLPAGFFGGARLRRQSGSAEMTPAEMPAPEVVVMVVEVEAMEVVAMVAEIPSPMMVMVVMPEEEAPVMSVVMAIEAPTAEVVPRKRGRSRPGGDRLIGRCGGGWRLGLRLRQRWRGRNAQRQSGCLQQRSQHEILPDFLTEAFAFAD